jgi:thioesterase domain-containing protein
MHERIPLSQAMQVKIVQATEESVTLAAPLAPNINHRQTVFGGSASAVALLAGWALLFLRLRHERLDGYIVVRRSVMNYERPMLVEFTGSAALAAGATWDQFSVALKQKGRARVTLSVVLRCEGKRTAALEAEFVVVTPA